MIIRGIGRIVLVIATTVALAVGTVVGTEPAAAGANSPTGTPVSPTNAVANIQQRVLPVAGDGSYLVYVQGRPQPGDCGPDQSARVRDAAGHVRSLAAPQLVACATSLVGSWLAAGTFGAPHAAETVHWWDISGSRHGSRALPRATDRFVGATPGGWIFVRGGTGLTHSTVLREGTGGKVTILGTFKEFRSIVVGLHGVVLADRAKPLRYLRFGQTKPAVIGRPGPQFLGGGGPEGALAGGGCNFVTASYAVCSADEVDDDGFPFKWQVTFVPLDGSAPTTCTTCLPGETVGYDLGGFAATPKGITGSLDDGRLRTVHPDGTVVTSAGAAVRGYGVAVPAFGEVVTEHVPGTLTEQTDATGTARVLVRLPRTVARATDFSLTTGRIVWKSDENLRQSSHTYGTLSRDLDGTTLGDARKIVESSGYPTGVAASGSTTIVARHLVNDTSGFGYYGYQLGYEKTTGVTDPVLQVSGNRVLYFAPAGAGLVQPMLQQIDIDLASPTAVGPVQRAKHGSHWLQPAAIWGDNVYYAEPHGGIARRDLADGTTSTVLAPDASLPVHPAMEIFAYGDEVGWDIGASRVAYRDVTSSAAPISVASGTNRGRVITGLSVDGVTVNAQGLLPYRNLSGIATVFRLVPYGATGGPAVLSGSHLLRGPQLNNSVEAWLDDSNVVRESALPNSVVVTAAPRYLGSPYLREFGSHLLVPYSEPLTSCTIDVSQGGTPVRTLPCSAKDMRTGEAVANDVGSDASGHLVHGDITYTVHAAGSGGTAVLADGSSGDVSGTFHNP